MTGSESRRARRRRRAELRTSDVLSQSAGTDTHRFLPESGARPGFASLRRLSSPRPRSAIEAAVASCRTRAWAGLRVAAGRPEPGAAFRAPLSCGRHPPGLVRRSDLLRVPGAPEPARVPMAFTAPTVEPVAQPWIRSERLWGQGQTTLAARLHLGTSVPAAFSRGDPPGVERVSVWVARAPRPPGRRVRRSGRCRRRARGKTMAKPTNSRVNLLTST
jgi:hypothetical protein